MSSSSNKKKRKGDPYTTPDTPDKKRSTRPVYRHKRFMESEEGRRRLAMARHPTAMWEKKFHASRKQYEQTLDRDFKRSFINKFGSISDSDGDMINFIMKKLIESFSRDKIKKLKEVNEYEESDNMGKPKVDYILVSMGPIVKKHLERAKKYRKVLKDKAKEGTGKDNEVAYLLARAERERKKIINTEDGLRKMTGRNEPSPIPAAGQPGMDMSISSSQFRQRVDNPKFGGRRKKKYTKRKRRRRRTKKRRRKRNLKKRTRRRRRKSKRRRRR
tara:strand:- start:1761 stop:2579 length:819 start_codon:yes stop_codon:yes gene_type:complete